MSLIPTISESSNLFADPALNFRWMVYLPTDVSYSGSQLALNSAYSNNNNGLLSTPLVPWGRVESVQLSGVSIDSDGRFVAGGKIHYPRFVDVEACTVTMYEDMNYNSLNYFINWRNLVVDPYHNYNGSQVYKRTVYFFAFDAVDDEKPRLAIQLHNAWPTNPGQGLSYEYTSSGMVTLPVTLSVDDATYHFNPYSSD